MDEVKYYMEESLLEVSADALVADVAKIMRDNAVSCLLVKEKDDFSGIVTDTDFTRKVIAEGKDPGKETIGSIMTRSLVSIDGEKTMAAAFLVMRQNNIRHLPVTEEGKIRGMLSIKDFGNYYTSKFAGKPEPAQGE